jgi:adrenodoxin-NADP+ reductase
MFISRRRVVRFLGDSKSRTTSGNRLQSRLLFCSSSPLSRSEDAQHGYVSTRSYLRQGSGSRIKPSHIKRHELKSYYSTSTTASPRPFRLAIVGSGPAGFYTASRVLKHYHDTNIDMYEKLPVPFGLVRYGVAPDHPEVKNCQERFEEIAETPGFQFIGNVDVGGQIPLDVLRRHYDAILFTYGANQDRELGIEGEHLRGVWGARSFVAWYNGLPGYSDIDFDLGNADNAVIIGQGNVSLDVARILLSQVDSLRKTDIPEHVLEALDRSNVKHVIAVGRRGPLQVRFSSPLILEFPH